MTLRHPHFFIYHLGPKPVISHFTFLISHLAQRALERVS